MTDTRLISADSHVQIPIEVVRERVPAGLREAFDDAIAEAAAEDRANKGGRDFDLSKWDLEATQRPRVLGPDARLAAMDRDGVAAEVLYSEVSAFRHFGLIKGDWKPISRAFTDRLADFASVDPDRLVVSYQVPVIDVEYAVAEVQRLAALGARSVHLPNYPSELGLPDYHEARYDPLWAVLSRRPASAISHHLGNRFWHWDVFRRDPTPQSGIFTSLPCMGLAEVIGVLDPARARSSASPTCRSSSSSRNLGWVPDYLRVLDYDGRRPLRLPGA